MKRSNFVTNNLSFSVVEIGPAIKMNDVDRRIGFAGSTFQAAGTFWVFIMARTKKNKVIPVIDSDTALVADRWLYRWTGDPPRDFCLAKTLFQPLTPADIVANGWRILRPAVTEAAGSLEVVNVGADVDWLKLESVRRNACLLGIHGDRTVAAAAPLSAARKPFIPFRFFEILHGNPAWHDVRYCSSHRHFVAKFHTGRTFCTDRLGLWCDVGYYLHFGIHGVHSLWSVIRIGDRPVGVPQRLRLSESLSDLPGKIDRISRLGQSFVGKLGAAWLRHQDRPSLWRNVSALLTAISAPAYRFNELRHDAELDRCMTKLDLLLFLSKIFQSDPTASATDMLKLSRTLYTMNP